jgi:uncharacterized protein (TIGR02271 family)
VRHEEEVTGVDTRWRGAGYLHIRKQVERERVRQDHPRDVEEVELRRAPVGEEDSGQVETLPDGSISIPVFEEELVVTKRRVLRERVLVRKRTITEHQKVRAELRKERVSFEADEGIDVAGDLAQSRPRPQRPIGASKSETRPFFTSEFLALVAVIVALAIAAATDALDGAMFSILLTVGVAAFVLSRGLAKARTPTHESIEPDQEERQR